MYTQVTKQGYEIISKIKEENGRLHVIAKRKADYIVCLGYNEQTGTWDQGRYDFKTLTDATKALFEEKFEDLKSEREHELLNACLNEIAESVSSSDLYDVLSGSLGMSDKEIKEYDLEYCMEEE